MPGSSSDREGGYPEGKGRIYALVFSKEGRGVLVEEKAWRGGH